jgi:hypothetical protein
MATGQPEWLTVGSGCVIFPLMRVITRYGILSNKLWLKMIIKNEDIKYEFKDHIKSITYYEEAIPYGLLKDLIFIVRVIFKILSLISIGKTVYLNEVPNSKKLIIVSKKYLFDLRLSLLGNESSVISLERLELPLVKTVKFRLRVSDIIVLIDAVKNRRNILQIIHCLLDYVMLMRCRINVRNFSQIIANDPADPFVHYCMSNIASGKKIFLCETAISKLSYEWTTINPEFIYVPTDYDQAEIINNLFNITPKKINLRLNRNIVGKHRYDYLFFHQYYHPSAFKSFYSHVIINIKLACRNNTLMRLHPNIGRIELMIYKLLAVSGIINISVEKYEHDASNCRFAFSISSTAVAVFKQRTGRPAKNIMNLPSVKKNCLN